MIGLLQRVSEAEVRVDGGVIARVGTGLVVLVGVQREDTDTDARRLAERLLSYRVFADDQGRMNRSVRDVNGGLLLVPQFTLAADTGKGTRPGFSGAADPERGRLGFERLVAVCRDQHFAVECGRFGADMAVALVNDGPVTFELRTRSPR